MIEDTLDSLKSQMGHVFGSEEDFELLNEGREEEEEEEKEGGKDADTDKKRKADARCSVCFGCVELGFTQRMVLGIGFLVAGLLLLSVSPLFVVSPAKFGWVYTFGNVFVLCSCAFIVGSIRQFRVTLQDRSKMLAIVMYVTAMVFTLAAALRLGMALMTMFFVAFQFCSAIWYVGSYIPYAHSCLSTTAKTLLPL